MKRDSHAMTEANWAALDQAAKAVGCPSWRVMIRRIACGELTVRKATPELDALGKALGASTRECGVLREPEQVTLARHALAMRRNAAPIARPSEEKRKAVM